jgi:hypothetical protein
MTKMINNWQRVTTKVSLATETIDERRRRWEMMKVSLITNHRPSTDSGG